MIKKKILIAISVLFFVSSIVPVNLIAASVERDSVDVEFTSNLECNIGFHNGTPVSGTLKPVSSGFKEYYASDIPYIDFHAASDGSGYTTGKFYLYAQVFTTNKIKISITEHEPFIQKVEDGGKWSPLHYTNSGISTSMFTGSSQSGPVTIFYETGNTGVRTKPEVFNFEFCFNIPISDINGMDSSYKNSEQTCNFKVTLEVI